MLSQRKFALPDAPFCFHDQAVVRELVHKDWVISTSELDRPLILGHKDHLTQQPTHNVPASPLHWAPVKHECLTAGSQSGADSLLFTFR